MNNNTTTGIPAAFAEFLWAIQQQYKFGARTHHEAVEMAIAWGESGGMTVPDIAECSRFMKGPLKQG